MARKTVIAVDCDDVLIETAQPIISHFNHQYGTNITFEGYYSPEYAEVWRSISGVEAGRKRDSYLDSKEYMQLAPLRETVEILRRLKERYELHIVTGRPSFSQDVTLEWLARHLPDIFETVVFTDYFLREKARSKADVCAELGAKYLVDDHLQHCEAVASKGVKALLFGDYPWNRTDTLEVGIRRVADWGEVERVLLDD